jgi:hypothetical protein
MSTLLRYGSQLLAELNRLMIELFSQGAPGAYSEAAAYDAFPGCEAVPCEQFDAAFQVNCFICPCTEWVLA